MPRQPRHWGPAEIKRNRQCGARHQAVRTMASTTSTSSVTAPVTTMSPNSSASVTTKSLTASVTSLTPSESKRSVYKCDICYFRSPSKNGVSGHIGHAHRKDYTETFLETNNEDTIPHISGPLDDFSTKEEVPKETITSRREAPEKMIENHKKILRR